MDTDDFVEDIIRELHRCKPRDERPPSHRHGLTFYQHQQREVRQSLSRVRGEDLKAIPADELKEVYTARHALSVLARLVPQAAGLLWWTEPPKRMEGYRCGTEAFDLIELLCGQAPTSATAGGPFRSITDLLLQAAGIKIDSKGICRAVLRARHGKPGNQIPRNEPPPLGPPPLKSS